MVGLGIVQYHIADLDPKADGTCVIDIFHRYGLGPGLYDTAKYKDISGAAERLYGTCVARGGQRPQGGWISDLGQCCLFGTLDLNSVKERRMTVCGCQSALF